MSEQKTTETKNEYPPHPLTQTATEKVTGFLDSVVEVTGIKDLVNTIMGHFINWGRRSSLWPLHVGFACCAIEMAAAGAGRFDMERHGVLFRSSPRQCDLLIVSGSVTKKMAPRVKLLYEQMPEPKYVIAMGACTIAGGPFYDSYSMVDGIDQLMPVDVYVPGCPPRPEALIDGILMLQKKIKSQREEVFKIR